MLAGLVRPLLALLGVLLGLLGLEEGQGLGAELRRLQALIEVLRQLPERGRDRVRRGGQQLAVAEGEERLLARLDRRRLRAPQVLADLLVEILLLGRGREVLHDAAAVGVAHVLAHLPAQRALHHGGQPLLQLGDGILLEAAALGIHLVAAAEGVLRAEDLLVQQGHQPEQLHQVVLERGGGEQQLGAALEGGSEGLARLVAMLVGIAQAVGLVDDDEIPGDLRQQGRLVRRERVRADDGEGLIEAVAGGAHGAAVHEHGLQIELLLELAVPLRAQGGGREDEDAVLPLGDELADGEARLDRLAEAHLVREHAAAARNGVEREGRGLDLVRVEVDLGLGQGVGHPLV
jgi:hypothetical protein